MRIRIPLTLSLYAALGLLPSCGDDKPAPTSSAPKIEGPKSPLIQKTEIADWCPEHGVPESICTRCNTALAPEFQKKGDWCKSHGLPESQCFTCHPELEAKFLAMKPKSAK